MTRSRLLHRAALNGNSAHRKKLEGLCRRGLERIFRAPKPSPAGLRGGAAEDPLDDAVASSSKTCSPAKPSIPAMFGTPGCGCLKRCAIEFVQELIVALANWHRIAGRRSSRSSFLIDRPRATVPPIEEVLSDKENDQCFIASLLIAATGAVDLEFDDAYRAHLQTLAHR